MNYVLKLDEERINFLIDLLLDYRLRPTADNDELLIAKEIYTDLSVLI